MMMIKNVLSMIIVFLEIFRLLLIHLSYKRLSNTNVSSLVNALNFVGENIIEVKFAVSGACGVGTSGDLNSGWYFTQRVLYYDTYF